MAPLGEGYVVSVYSGKWLWRCKGGVSCCYCAIDTECSSRFFFALLVVMLIETFERESEMRCDAVVLCCPYLELEIKYVLTIL